MLRCRNYLVTEVMIYVHPPHRPRSENKYQQKNHCGEVLNFSFMKIIRRFLLFARLSYYFTPYNRLTDYSLQVHKLTKSSTLLSFWPAGFIPPPNDWKLTDIFFPISTLWARCGWEIGTLSVKVEMMWLVVGNMIVLSLVFLQQGWVIFIIK